MAWMTLSYLQDDVKQIQAIASLLWKDPDKQQRFVKWQLALLRWECWSTDNWTRKKPLTPQEFRHYKDGTFSGYRTRSDYKHEVRMQLTPERRKEIAKQGQQGILHKATGRKAAS